MTADETAEPAFEHADITPERTAELGDLLREREWTDEPFEVDGVSVDAVEGGWVVMLGVYAPPESFTAADRDELDEAVAWVGQARTAAHDAWGEPAIREPHFVGEDQVPEGLVDLLLSTLNLEQAELWDRGERFIALMTGWQGEPEASQLMQVMLILPRRVAMGGLSELADDSVTEQPRLMHGESLGELHRRAAIMSALFAGGEARLDGAGIDATRCNLLSRDGMATTWIFAADGRALLLIRDPEVAIDDGTDEGELAASSRMLTGVPEDLLACVAAPGTRPDGTTAQQVLEFGLIADQPVPRVTGVFWFDGETWHTTRALVEISTRSKRALDDFGFVETVRRPYRLGGTFTADDFVREDDDDFQRVTSVFDRCPYPQGPRPDAAARLGNAVPVDQTHADIVDDIERVTQTWWSRSSQTIDWRDDAFQIGGRSLIDDDDDRVIATILAEAEDWYTDDLAEWVHELFQEMSDRWGHPYDVNVHDGGSGKLLRSPLTRIMRASNFDDGPMWWVNGHAVVLLAGGGSRASIGVPSVIIAIARADAVLDPMKGSSVWELRARARVIGSLAESGTGAEAIAWDGPVLYPTVLVPEATRGGIRTAFATWAWHFTHDGRALLLSCVNDFTPDTEAEDAFAQQAALLEGIPEDLLSLVVDRGSGGLYDVITRPDGYQDDRPGLLGSARTLPVLTGVMWRDGVDWRLSDGMLRRAYDVIRDAGDDNPLAWLTSGNVGLTTLGWVLRAGESFSRATFESESYTDFVLGAHPDPDEVEAAFGAFGPPLEAALRGSLNDVLDTRSVGPHARYLLDAALSNPDPAHRRETALWLLETGADPSLQLSFLTPLGVLFENPTLKAGDAAVVHALVSGGADISSTTTGATIGGHALAQLCDRDLDEAEIEPLYDAFFAGFAERAEIEAQQATGDAEPSDRIDVTAPAFRAGDTLLEYVSRGQFPHSHSRAGLQRRLAALAE
ncbi:hypothetical protein [Microbacterium sp.]|uniref:hypothetical protein n=1 Tax=Microbacterium sp. TaxID=51671 RepID=UPI0026060614|nr:hypothetical protein [Microbacterium sp.]